MTCNNYPSLPTPYPGLGGTARAGGATRVSTPTPGVGVGIKRVRGLVSIPKLPTPRQEGLRRLLTEALKTSKSFLKGRLYFFVPFEMDFKMAYTICYQYDGRAH